MSQSVTNHTTRRSVLRSSLGVVGGGLIASSTAVAQSDSNNGTDSASTGTTIDFRFEQADESTENASTATYDLIVSGAEDGVGAYMFTIGSGAPNSARISDVNLVAFGGQFSSVDIAVDGSKAEIEEATGDASVPGETFPIARVTVKAGDKAGEASLRVEESARVSTSAGSFYNIGARGNVTLTVNSDSAIETQSTAGSESSGSNATDQSTDSTPGFGVVSSVATVCAGYLLSHRAKKAENKK